MSVRHFLDCINWGVRHTLSVVDTYGLERKGEASLSTSLPLHPDCRHSVPSFPMLLPPQLPTMKDCLLKLWAKAEPSFPRFFWQDFVRAGLIYWCYPCNTHERYWGGRLLHPPYFTTSAIWFISLFSCGVGPNLEFKIDSYWPDSIKDTFWAILYSFNLIKWMQD